MVPFVQTLGIKKKNLCIFFVLFQQVKTNDENVTYSTLSQCQHNYATVSCFLCFLLMAIFFPLSRAYNSEEKQKQLSYHLPSSLRVRQFCCSCFNLLHFFKCFYSKQFTFIYHQKFLSNKADSTLLKGLLFMG